MTPTSPPPLTARFASWTAWWRSAAQRERSNSRMKLGFYLRYATRSLLRGGQRSVFAVFCVAVGVMVIVALQLVGNMVNISLTSNIRGLNGGDIAIHSENGIPTQYQSYFQTLKAQGTITAYTTASVSDATTNTTNGLQRLGIFAVDPSTYPLADAPQVISPANASLASLLQGDNVVITNTAADRVGAHVGDSYTITTDDGSSGHIVIDGIITNSGPMADRADILMNQQAFANMTDLLGRHVNDSYTWVWVNVPGDDNATAASVATEITRQVPGTTSTTEAQQEQQVHSEIEGIRTFLQIIGLLALLIGGIGIVNTMQVVLRNRLLEIAMLKTQGYRRRDLVLMFGLEAFFFGLFGGLLGAAIGIGMSIFVVGLVERAFLFIITPVIDPGIVASGVVIGIATTFIFGLLPILQTSAIRPLAVLRETPETAGCKRALTTTLLIGLLGVLFFLLATSILRNPVTALLVVGGMGLLLVLLTFAFTGLAWLLSAIPVPDGLRWWSVLPVVALLALAALLIHIVPAFALLLFVLAVVCLVVPLLSRPAHARVRLAIRNIGRAKIRSATTLLALFVGVFAIGMGLTLGQSLKDALLQLGAAHNAYNAYVLADHQAGPAVAAHLHGVAGLRGQQVTIATPARIIATNGKPVVSPKNAGEGANLLALDGLNLAAGQTQQVTIAQGQNDSQPGRMLNTSDAGGTNALLPYEDSQAPLNLKLGDSITVGSVGGLLGQLGQPGAGRVAPVTLHVVGFYYGGIFSDLGTVLVDDGVVNTLSGGQPFYIYSLRLDTATMTQTLQQLKTEVPGIVTLGDAAAIQQIDTLLDNIVQAVESLAMLAGLIMIANTVALAMLERRRELGILKSVGHTSGSVLATVLVENGIIGVAGAFCAVVLVVLIATLVEALTFHSPHTSGLSPTLVVGLVVGTAALCMLVTGGVAWSATRVRPLNVLRYE